MYRRIFLGLIVLAFRHQIVAVVGWAAKVGFGLATAQAVEALAGDLITLALTAGLIWLVAQGLLALARRLPRRGR